ncbi:type II toxin-antitoxin system PemK/MazF family toxin [Siminovitchia sp. 179-K 8D1 HS]|uniref:type II toxin-antitoxin system PemK/MazF family toxin n=1 Tax=Siminovitchia sp. 179-K 8D1 HS TaxID=3142385 RepID=UPI0039A1702A
MNYEQRDIILVPFPFSDQRAYKKRPAVIISNNKHHDRYGKYVCLAITSQEKKPDQNRYEYKLRNPLDAGLIYGDQWVLPNKIFTIEDKFIQRKLGSMKAIDFDQVVSLFYEIFI